MSDSTKSKPVQDAWSQPEDISHQKKSSADAKIDTVTGVGLKSTHLKVVYNGTVLRGLCALYYMYYYIRSRKILLVTQ